MGIKIPALTSVIQIEDQMMSHTWNRFTKSSLLSECVVNSSRMDFTGTYFTIIYDCVSDPGATSIKLVESFNTASKYLLYDRHPLRLWVSCICRQILSCLSHQGSLLWEESDQTRSLPSRNLHFIARKNKQKYILNLTLGTSLMVQLLRLHTSNSGGAGLIPGWGTKTPQAMHVCKCVCVCVYWKADKKVVIEQPLYHVVSCWKNGL